MGAQEWLGSLATPVPVAECEKRCAQLLGVTASDARRLAFWLLRRGFLEGDAEPAALSFPFPSTALFHQESEVFEDVDDHSLSAILADPVTGRAAKLNSPALFVWLLCKQGTRAEDPRLAPLASDALPQLFLAMAQMGFLYATDGSSASSPWS